MGNKFFTPISNKTIEIYYLSTEMTLFLLKNSLQESQKHFCVCYVTQADRTKQAWFK